MIIRPVGAELFHEDGQTDTAKPTVAFREQANAPHNNDRYVMETNATPSHIIYM